MIDVSSTPIVHPSISHDLIVAAVVLGLAIYLIWGIRQIVLIAHRRQWTSPKPKETKEQSSLDTTVHRFPYEECDVAETLEELLHPKAHPVDKLDEQSIKNWQRIPAFMRKNCVNHLRKRLLESDDGYSVLAHYHEQHENGISLGSDEYCFHFGTGMWIRNVCREIMPDHILPMTKSAGGTPWRNWDDLYIGALDELASQPLPENPKQEMKDAA